MAGEIRHVRARIPKSLKIEFEVACAREEKSHSAAIEEAIRDWLKKYGYFGES